MAHLESCPGCARHVRADEPTCPFCDAPLDFADAAGPVMPRRRLGRAALMAFGGAALASALSACGDDADPPGPAPAYGAPAPDAGPATGDAGDAPAPLYGGAPGD